MSNTDDGGPVIWVPDVEDHRYEPDAEGWCILCGGSDLDPLHSNVWDDRDAR